jgi:hypothetical protein
MISCMYKEKKALTTEGEKIKHLEKQNEIPT